MVKKKQINWTPYAIVGLIVVLALLVLYPKSSPTVSPQPQPETTKVTVENEFSQPKPPETVTISVTSPLDRSTVTSSTLTVKGKTVPNAEVYVNNVDGKADGKGNFSIVYTLDEGENYLLIGANDEIGNNNEVQLTVSYETL